MDNIILTGMPGAGKSTVGVILAKNLGMDFIDVDILIAKREKSTLQEIIDHKGIEAFLKIEEAVALDLIAENTVISTGGSMVLSECAMEHLGKMGVNIYLDLPVSELKNRLSNIKTRGIASKPGETVDVIYSVRKPLYEKYKDVTIDCWDKNTEDIVDEISKYMSSSAG